jgi:uncharacterized protein YdhG (YjbR/CyaY superfamily)
MSNLIDLYIEKFPLQTQEVLNEMRNIILEVIPNAEQVIGYQMPAFKLNGILVYFAGYKNHVGFYPTASGIENFSHEFGNYKWSKGAVQFPLNEPLPKDLIQRIVKFRLEEISVKK